jgi:hypothetical protein
MFAPAGGWSVRRVSSFMKTFSWLSVAVVSSSVVCFSTVGCKPRAKKAAATTEAAASPPPAQSAAPAPTGIPKHMPKEVAESLMFRVLVGPQLLIQPGKGIGPIRFGATAETVERLMESKPTEVVQTNGLTVMRYQSHAVEFTLQDGVVVKVYIHGNEREYTQGGGHSVANVYGIFNGAFANGGKLGMYSQYANQGEPKRIEKVEPGRFSTVERHHYESMVLEYDRLANGNVVLAGVILMKPGWREPSPTGKTP